MSIHAVLERGTIAEYANSYSGYTKIARLLFIASRIKSGRLELDALKMALDESIKECNTNLYRKAAEMADGRLGSSYAPDEEWVQRVDQQAARREEMLELHLKNFQNLGSVKDIQISYENLGNFYYERGDLLQASKNYALAHGSCDTAELRLHINLRAIVASVQIGALEGFETAYSAVSSAQEEPGVADSLVLAKLQIAAGLSKLGMKDYKEAAEQFVGVSFELQNNFSEVVAPHDVATYGGLCALYSFDRAELKRKVIDNVSFNRFLELVPEVRELVYDYYACRYGSCLQYLRKLEPSLSLDIYLHDHVERLYVEIRQNAMIQYTVPFSVVNLKVMARVFKTSSFLLEQELAPLILDEKIEVTNLWARI